MSEQEYWLCCGSLDPMHKDEKAKRCLEHLIDPFHCRYGTAIEHSKSSSNGINEIEALIKDIATWTRVAHRQQETIRTQQSNIDRLLSSLKLNVPNCEAAFCNAKATYEYHDYEGTFCKCEKHKGSLYEINDGWNEAVRLIAEIEAKND